MIVVFDENISHHLSSFIKHQGGPGSACHVRDNKWNGNADIDWMNRATKLGWGILTADRNEATRGILNKEFVAMGAKVVLLGQFWGDLDRWNKAKWMLSHWEAIHLWLDALQAGGVGLANKIGPIAMLEE